MPSPLGMVVEQSETGRGFPSSVSPAGCHLNFPKTKRREASSLRFFFGYLGYLFFMGVF